jgi:NADP-dependent 3-hydroxy acid dehydrogenase YdfG
MAFRIHSSTNYKPTILKRDRELCTFYIFACMKKKALITGATAGIGEATARLLAKNGIDLILNGRRSDRLQSLKERLESDFNISVLLMPVDVRIARKVEAFIKQIPEEWRNINILINNAGLAAGLEDIENGNLDHWNQMIDTNIRGLLHTTKYMIPLLKSVTGAHIINIGSIAGKEVYPNGNVYCGTKHMVDALNKSMRRELAEYNIKVSSVNPGAVETEFSIVRMDGDEAKAGQVYAGFQNLVADDIADAIWYILSRPDHVNINELIIMPKAQPAAGVIIRNRGL